MIFDFEKYLMFWKLRDIVTDENLPVNHLKSIDGRKIVLDNGNKHYTIIYNKIGPNKYQLLIFQVISADSVWGSAVETIDEANAQRVLDEI